jgi:hypothetical protein
MNRRLLYVLLAMIVVAAIAVSVFTDDADGATKSKPKTTVSKTAKPKAAAKPKAKVKKKAKAEDCDAEDLAAGEDECQGYFAGPDGEPVREGSCGSVGVLPLLLFGGAGPAVLRWRRRRS